jgi:hypothetical protein
MSATMLPKPPNAAEIDFVWLLANKATLAAYMQTVYALANAQVVVTVGGIRLPAQAIKISGESAVLEVLVS